VATLREVELRLANLRRGKCNMASQHNSQPMLLENALAPKIIANKIHAIDEFESMARFTLTAPPMNYGTEDVTSGLREVAGYVYFPIQEVPEAIGFATFRLGHLWVTRALPTWAGGNRISA
jgi:hypothetical protein